MYQSIVVIWLSLFIYILISLKAKIIGKKERKWMYLLVAVALGFSILAGLNISLHGVTTFMNHTFGRLSRMVVNI
ncbi:hypothetical protein [Bacillus sp. FJAT-29814]|uniref:hypothetical protein n=1 Tax=Bacillus sp. FJAT-29814 TaxID=1729688 RepID=UPI00082B67DA|nr:hypothetical protein [Bacillus sp. FJAT-29814]